MPDPHREKRLSWALRNGAHLAALSAFALAQPIFDILGRNPEFFAVRGSTATEIVLFALVVAFALPTALVAVELAASLLSRRLAQGLHLLFVGGLTGLVALHVLAKTESLSGPTALVGAATVGAAGAFVYARARPARAFLSVLAPAPVVFLLLFLVGSSVSKLVFVESAEATTVAVQARTPVVLIVFDELTTASLLDGHYRVDARRFPGFASLAHDATWYRSATTVHGHTTKAVPAILDGKLPDPDLLPTLADHPRNLFTLLGRSYELQAIESGTSMCPPSLCRGERSGRFDPAAESRTRSLASDVGIVYLHLLLPDPYEDDLPPISNTWGNFAGDEETEEGSTRSAGKPVTSVPACGRGVCRFASLISADRGPVLYFMHTLLPHVPWLYLPSGKHYSGDVRVIPGDDDGTWTADPWPAAQAQQRYLLQLGYADRALGLVLGRLRAAGVYDRALVIVTADHGITFRPGAPRRSVNGANLSDIAFVPLFVKLPGQQRGRIDDSHARTVDILPTIAHVLETRVPWRVDGRSLVGRQLPSDATVTLVSAAGRPVQAQMSALLEQRAESVSGQHALFGTGATERIYRIGPNRELLGKGLGALDVRPSRRASVELDGRELLSVVDLSTDLMPTYLTGSISGVPPGRDLAVAVNGTIRAVTRTFTERGATMFQAFVPETALRAGANDVAVFAVSRTGRGAVLEELRRNELTFALETAGEPAITTSDGGTIRVLPKALAGTVGVRRAKDVTFTGWAADLRARRAAEWVVVFVDGRGAYAGRPGNLVRNDVHDRYGIDDAGFSFRLPASLLPDAGSGHQVRVFAIGRGAASELTYPAGYPWSTGP